MRLCILRPTFLSSLTKLSSDKDTVSIVNMLQTKLGGVDILCLGLLLKEVSVELHCGRS